jgi:peptide/nickel transport system permease protein
MTTTVEQTEAPRLNPRRVPIWVVLGRVLRRKPSRIVGVAIIAIFLVMAAIGPYLYPHLPIDTNAIYASPSSKHWLGTDFEGTDVLALVVSGARYVIASALVAAIVTVLVGTGVGLLSGYHRGFTDSALMRVTDFVLTVPGFPLLVVLSTIWKFDAPVQMGFVLGITGWGGLARAVRAQTLSLRERGFLEAARGLGLPTRHIVAHEVLPNVAPYIAMNLLLAITGAIYAEVGLFFIGVVPFTTNNWGVMLNQAVFSAGAMTSTQALSYLLSPLICILLLTLGIVLVVDAMDELFNPRLRAR